MAQRSLSFADSLRESWKEPAVKERRLTTPLALYTKRPPPPPDNPWKGRKGGGKDGKKGGGKAAGKAGKPKGANRTPDGKPICFRFQSKGGCRKGAKCHFAHVCCHCFGNHAGHAVGRRQEATADTQGCSEHLDFAKEKFEEDIAEGTMEKMTSRQFRKKFGKSFTTLHMASE